MLVAERHREIVAIVERESSVRVVELARLLRVTEETIRRDLEKLESEGRLQRTHGGAVRVEGSRDAEVHFAQREISYVQEKTAIAHEAIKTVAEGDTIYLDASSTALRMAQLLPDIRLTVLTHAIKVAIELSNRNNITVIVNGGILAPSSLSFIGPQAERFLTNYHVDKLYFSCKGVSFSRGLSESSEWQATLKSKMMTISDEKYLLVDHSKFNANALTVFADIKEVDHIITNSSTDKDTVQKLRDDGPCHVVVAP
jgi:DeoR/GlpR family transcriptional regulator of sugar metabolism